jgi:hypothetical protein
VKLETGFCFVASRNLTAPRLPALIHAPLGLPASPSVPSAPLHRFHRRQQAFFRSPSRSCHLSVAQAVEVSSRLNQGPSRRTQATPPTLQRSVLPLLLTRLPRERGPRSPLPRSSCRPSTVVWSGSSVRQGSARNSGASIPSHSKREHVLTVASSSSLPVPILVPAIPPLLSPFSLPFINDE